MNRLLMAAALVFLVTAEAAAQTAPVPWKSVCPDGIYCGTATLRADGMVVVPTSIAATEEFRIVSPTDFSSTAAPWFCRGVVMRSGNCLIGGAAGGTVVDPTGLPLYAVNCLDAAAANAVELYPDSTLYFADTLISHVVIVGPSNVNDRQFYLSGDEGRTWTGQATNIQFTRGLYPSPDGQRLWTWPFETNGLFQSPSLAETGGRVDLTHFAHVDGGSFPPNPQKLVLVPASAALPGGYSVAIGQQGIATSVDAGRTWVQGTFAGPVDDLVFPTANNIDIQAIAAGGSVLVSRDRGATWRELGHGLPSSRYRLSAANGMLLAAGDYFARNGMLIGNAGTYSFVCPALACLGAHLSPITPVYANLTLVSEFYHAGLGHYFITADEVEKLLVRSGGAGAGWTETGQTFNAWSQAWAGDGVYVCRFYGDASAGPNSHFYTASSDECRGLLALQQSVPDGRPRWNIEGYSFRVALPGAAGTCAPGLVPVYRAYNNGAARGIDSNHRYVLDPALLQPMVAAGWKDEGTAFCVPATAKQ